MRLPTLGFGGAPVGNLYSAMDDAAAAATIETAWSNGVRHFDTAPHYGLGLSERRVGAVLATRPRSEMTISTKVGRLLVPNPQPSGSDLTTGGFDVPDDLTRISDYSADGVLRSLEASLTRLGLDRVDVVYVHDPDNDMEQAVAEAVPTLVRMREQGVVGAVGVGMNHWPPLERFVTDTDVDVVMVAGRWTLLDRTAEPLLSACLEHGVSAVLAAPFNSGLLARTRPAEGSRFDYVPAGPDLVDRARRLAAVCEEFGATLPQAALQFGLRHPAVVSVVAGMRTPAEVTADVEWATTPVDEGLWSALEAS